MGKRIFTWFWAHIGEPVLTYLLRRVTTNKIIVVYIGAIVSITGPFFVNNIVAYYKGIPLFQVSSETSWSIQIVAIVSMTLVVMFLLWLQKRRFDTMELSEDSIAFVKGEAHDEIGQLLPIYKDAISQLKLKDACETLKKIRYIVTQSTKVDYQFVSKVDYYIAESLRYINLKEAIQYYDQAYDEMKKSKSYHIEIATGKMFAELKEGRASYILDLCSDVLERDPQNIIAKVCKFVGSSSTVCYKDIPSELKYDVVFLSYLYPFLIKDLDFKEALEKLDYTIPSNLEFSNIDVWFFYMTISINRLNRHEGYNLLYNPGHHSRYIKDVYYITCKFLELSEDTDLKEDHIDINIYYTYTHFNLQAQTNEQKRIDIVAMQQYHPTPDFKPIHLMMLSEMLLTCRDFNGVIHLLEDNAEMKEMEYGFLWVVSGLHTNNVQYIRKGLNHFIKYGYKIPSSCSEIFMMAISPFYSDLSDIIRSINFESSSIQLVYDIAVDYYCNQKYDIHRIIESSQSCPNFICYILADILARENEDDLALKILQPKVSFDRYTANVECFIRLLHKKKDRTALFHSLRVLRQHGYNARIDYLQWEYNLATQCNDIKDALEVSSILFHKHPNEPYFTFFYAKSLLESGNKGEINSLVPLISELKPLKDDQLVINLTNILLIADKAEAGLEFLFMQMQTNRSQNLKDYFFMCSTSPATSQYINGSKDVVEENDYVFYNEDGNPQEDIVFRGSVVDTFIGHHVGDTMSLTRFQVTHKVTITDIKNKYFAVLKNFYRELNEHHTSKSIQSFTLDDLKSYNGNLLDGIVALTGGRDAQQMKNDFEKRYSEGKASFLAESRIESAFADCANRIFGDEIIYTVPYQYFNNLPIASFTYILDLSSLLLLSSLSKRFGLTFEKKFLVPEGLHLFIKHNIEHEAVNIPSLIHPSAFINYGFEVSANQTKAPIQLVLDDVEAWMENNCTYEVVDDILKLHTDGLKNEGSIFFQIEAESMLLALKASHAMISEDWGLIKFIARNFRVINSASWLKLSGVENIDKIFHCLADIHFAGIEVGYQYMFDQYTKKQTHQPNSFDTCVEGLRINGCLWREGMELAQEIVNKKIKLPGDNFVATKVMVAVLESLSPEGRNMLISEIHERVNANTLLAHCFDEAIKQSRTIII